MTFRAYKLRFYPTQAQIEQLEVEFGNARFVWNWAIDLRRKAYARRQERHNYASINRLVTRLKKTRRYCWLSNSTAACLIQKLKDLDHAYECFFKGTSKYPANKRKHGRQSVRYQLDPRHISRLCIPGVHLQLPNLGALKLKWSRVPDAPPKMVTVSRDPSGRYFVSFGVIENIEPVPVANGSVGLDLGIKTLVVDSNGGHVLPRRAYYQYQKQLARADRCLSRRVRGSKRWEKQRRRLARIHSRIADTRLDYLHKLTTSLIRNNQLIAIEDLNLTAMRRNRPWAKALADASFGEIRRQLSYKAEWHGRELVVVDRFAPTSKTCSACGWKNQELTLGDRRWTCTDCGATHDRDVNAAINILNTAGRAGIDARGAWQTPIDATAGPLQLTAGVET